MSEKCLPRVAENEYVHKWPKYTFSPSSGWKKSDDKHQHLAGICKYSLSFWNFERSGGGGGCMESISIWAVGRRVSIASQDYRAMTATYIHNYIHDCYKYSDLLIIFMTLRVLRFAHRWGSLRLSIPLAIPIFSLTSILIYIQVLLVWSRGLLARQG